MGPMKPRGGAPQPILQQEKQSKTNRFEWVRQSMGLRIMLSSRRQEQQLFAGSHQSFTHVNDISSAARTFDTPRGG